LKSLLYNYYKKLEIKSHNLSYLFLEITRKCNLNCLHCGSDCKHELNVAELTTDSWIKIIENIKENFSTDLTFIITGGEPLLHPDLDIITDAIKKAGMKWGMVTNGLLLDKKKINNLLENKINGITLSLDGIESTHNKLRNNKNSYSKTISALKLIGESPIKFKDVVTCVYPDNLNQLDNIAKTLIENGISEWRLFRIFPSGRAKDNNELLLSFNQTQQMVNWIKQNRKQYKEKGLNINLSCEGWIPFKDDRKVRDNPFFCRAGINIASILCDGNITGCSNNNESFYEGNILKNDFSFIWENNFKKFRDRSWVNQTKCGNCEHLKKCQGSSIHLWEYGREKPSFCYVKPLH